ncbi:hypothetical protein [Nocardia jejuensis]|uniref:hypothetical protein n=1 Tax=Nocardia jejuensis TaxID=328049 RepID=UPI0008319270|nr:hypothetical protein [Nocardia jejuensis]
MRSHRPTLSVALLLATACATAATATATPPDTDAAVSYTATVSETSTVIHTDAGSLVDDHGVFKILAADGTVLGGTELAFRVDDFLFPIAARISGRTATLTPRFDMAHAVYEPVALPFEQSAPWKSEYDREQAAWSRMTSTIGMGATIGTLVGGIGGAAVGCLLGGAAGATLTGALTAMFGALPGALVGCIAGTAAVGFLGTLAGQLFITAPTAILAAAQYFTTINSPFAGK